MQAIPQPSTNGSLADLRESVNVGDEDWPLILAWLLAVFRLVGPYPMLALQASSPWAP